jgi:lipopolysaccharide/colanic/teichoic acid biosynthesis glycosyltransferase
VVEGKRSAVVLGRDALYRRSLAAADVVAATAAVLIGVVALGDDRVRPATLALLPLLVLASKVVGLYDRDEHLLRRTTLEEAPAVLQVAAMISLVAWVGESVFVDGRLGPGQLGALWVLLLAFMLLARGAARRLVGRITPAERCLLLGDGSAGERLVRSFGSTHLVNATVIGRVPLERGEASPNGTPVLGSLRTLGSVLKEHEIDRVLIAPRHVDSDQILDAIRLVKSFGAKVSVLPRLFEVVGSAIEFDEVEGLTLLGVPRHGLTRSSAFLKRSVDVAGAAVALLLLGPFLVAIALAIRLGSRGPAIVRERRIGRAGREFDILRFRTAVADGAPPPDRSRSGRAERVTGERTTRAGRFLRRISLEELPQLVNVLRGEMSLVGPRAPLPDEHHEVDGLHHRHLDLRPGITGIWRILGSIRIPPDEMVKFDYLYGANWSLWLDARILLRTLPAVLAQLAQPGDRDRSGGRVGDEESADGSRGGVTPSPDASNGEGLRVTESPPSASVAVAVAEQKRLRSQAGIVPHLFPATQPDHGLGALSVTAIVPATNSPTTLRECTEAIRVAQGSCDELIVVEHSPSVGPADARNHGASRATGDILVFVDADVVVHEDAFSRIRAAFDADPELTALFGAYDDGLDTHGQIATFRNLLHHYVHHRCAGPATTFWAGLGAVRRDAFFAVGGFDADRFDTPSVEDIELGMRLSRDGARIVLDPNVRGTHLKEWGLWEMVRTDFARRGVPWVSLLLRGRGAPPTTLNLSWGHRLSALFSLAGVGSAVSRRPLAAAGSLLGLVGLNGRFYWLLARRHGVGTAVTGIGLHLLHHLVSIAAVPAGLAAHLIGRREDGRPPRNH